jgi:hypothetical protein
MFGKDGEEIITSGITSGIETDADYKAGFARPAQSNLSRWREQRKILWLIAG